MRKIAAFAVIVFSLLTAWLLASPACGAQKFVVKIATLAPEGSAWMQVFNKINADVMKKTDKKVTVTIGYTIIYLIPCFPAIG